QYDLADWIEENIEVPVDHHNYHFDIGIKNGKLQYAINALSFQKADLRPVEEAGGYYAFIWRTVRQATGAKGLLLVEPPSESDVAQERFQLVKNWATAADIEVHNLEE